MESLIRNRVMLCYFGFFRSGEICIQSQDSFDAASNMTFLDVSVDNLVTPLLHYSLLEVKKLTNKDKE